VGVRLYLQKPLATFRLCSIGMPDDPKRQTDSRSPFPFQPSGGPMVVLWWSYGGPMVVLSLQNSSHVCNVNSEWLMQLQKCLPVRVICFRAAQIRLWHFQCFRDTRGSPTVASLVLCLATLFGSLDIVPGSMVTNPARQGAMSPDEMPCYF
jgi:hypothetical protein